MRDQTVSLFIGVRIVRVKEIVAVVVDVHDSPVGNLLHPPAAGGVLTLKRCHTVGSVFLPSHRSSRRAFSTLFADAGAILIAFTTVIGLACSPEPAEEPDKPDLSKIISAIDVIREKIGNAEGREGILAEQRRYSLFDEELIIRDFFQDRRGGFFLDVGCAWAEEASNTYYLEKHLGWKGIGIDALTDYGGDRAF